MTSPTSPFLPGVQVALKHRWTTYSNSTWTTGTVEKTIGKTGRFTLVGSKQQWRPCLGYQGRNWEATQTGEGFYRGPTAFVLDEVIAAEMEADKAQGIRLGRLNRIRDRVRVLKVGDVNDEQIDALEAALGQCAAP